MHECMDTREHCLYGEQEVTECGSIVTAEARVWGTVVLGSQIVLGGNEKPSSGAFKSESVMSGFGLVAFLFVPRLGSKPATWAVP